MNISWLSNHWFLLCFVFASGGAAAWQEVQRQTIEDVIIDQAAIAQTQKRANEAIIRLEEQMKHKEKRDEETSRKLDLLIELQLKAGRDSQL